VRQALIFGTAAQVAGTFCVAAPNHMTRVMALDHAELILGSLAELSFAELVELRQIRT